MGKITKKEAIAGKTLEILQELDFYGEKTIEKTTTQTTTTKKKDKSSTKTTESIKSSIDEGIVKKLEDLKKLYEAGHLTKEEYTKAKKILSE